MSKTRFTLCTTVPLSCRSNQLYRFFADSRPEQYNIVGNYLLGTIKEVLGNAFTPEIHTVWAVVYRQLADLMIGYEAQMYEETDEWTDWRDFLIARKV